MRADGTSVRVWRRSLYCGANGGCVEIALLEEPGGALIAIRDGTLPSAGALALEPGAWRTLLRHAKAGELDGPACDG